MRLPLRVEFSEYGGYDCMTSAHKIYDASNWPVLTVEHSEPCDCWRKNGSESECQHDRKLAEQIVLLLHGANL